MMVSVLIEVCRLFIFIITTDWFYSCLTSCFIFILCISSLPPRLSLSFSDLSSSFIIPPTLIWTLLYSPPATANYLPFSATFSTVTGKWVPKYFSFAKILLAYCFPPPSQWDSKCFYVWPLSTQLLDFANKIA